MIGERWERYTAVFDEWFTRLAPDDGLPERELRAFEDKAGQPLPEALRELYRLVGRRREVTDGQNSLVPPTVEPVKNGLVSFYIENQRCHLWSVQLGGGVADPVVLMDGTVHACKSVSDFAYGMLLAEVVCAGPGATGWLGGPAEAVVRSTYCDFGISVVLWDGGGETTFLRDADTVMFIDREANGDLALFARARTEDASELLRKIEGIVWEAEPAAGRS